MPSQRHMEDAEFHIRRADAERRVAIAAPCPGHAASRRRTAMEHEIAAYESIGSLPELPVFDEADFLRFVLLATLPCKAAVR